MSKVAYWNESLGEPTDCETCGFSMESLTVERHEGERWAAQYSTGCYGGGSWDIEDALDLPGLKAWLAEELGHREEWKAIKRSLFPRLDSGRPDYEEEEYEDVDPEEEIELTAEQVAIFDAEYANLLGNKSSNTGA